MRLGTAIERLVENYNYAVSKEWVQDKVAWALYHTWKEADERRAEQTEPQTSCKTCRYGEVDGGYVRCAYYSKADRKTEPQTYVINPQEPTNDDKCFECDDFFTCGGQCNKIEDEPQTEDAYAYDEDDWYDKTERSE